MPWYWTIGNATFRFRLKSARGSSSFEIRIKRVHKYYFIIIASKTSNERNDDDLSLFIR